MKVYCVIYDKEANKVLIDDNSLLSFSINSNNLNKEVLVDHIKENFGLNIIKSQVGIIHQDNNQVIVLLDETISQSDKYSWIDIEGLHRLKESLVLSIILNYFYRIDVLKMTTLKLAIVGDNDLRQACINLILDRNPGIRFGDEARGAKIVLSRETSYDTNTKPIKLVTDRDSEIKDASVLVQDTDLEEIYTKIMNIIASLYRQVIRNNTIYSACQFYGVTGMTESGKSYFAQYLDQTQNIWNVKIRTFIETAKYLVDPACTRLLEVMALQLMIEFSCFHYFKNDLLIESVYSYEFNSLLKYLFAKNYTLLYIDANETSRSTRSLDSMMDFRKKDLKKQTLGIDKLKSLADVIIRNSGDLKNSLEQLDQLFE